MFILPREAATQNALTVIQGPGVRARLLKSLQRLAEQDLGFGVALPQYFRLGQIDFGLSRIRMLLAQHVALYRQGLVKERFGAHIVALVAIQRTEMHHGVGRSAMLPTECEAEAIEGFD